jgi:co-chaperonin GroES (HSP10)
MATKLESVGGKSAPLHGSVTDYFKKKPAPFRPLLWHVLVQIPQPPEKVGSLYVPDEFRDSAEFASYVGHVAAVGEFAYTAVTKAGIDLAKCSSKPKVGDWVIFGKHAGEKFRTKDGTLWVLMADTEVRGVINNPDDYECVKL